MFQAVRVRMVRRWGVAVVCAAFAGVYARTQIPIATQRMTASTPDTPPAKDRAVDEAEALIGRATILRGCYTGGDLSFDAQGRVKGDPKLVPWTLAGVNITTVKRQGSGELELSGVRVAMRYNADAHVFERHPMKDQKVKIVLAVNDGARGLEGALATMFSVGIDPALQRAMPSYWRHYFSPGLPWTNADELKGDTIIAANAPPAGIDYPVGEKKPDPDFTNEARVDKVKGTVQLRVTVGTDGAPHRVAIRQPLGYGLDDRAALALEKWRFRPGTKDGKPAVIEVVVNQGFDYVQGPH